MEGIVLVALGVGIAWFFGREGRCRNENAGAAGPGFVPADVSTNGASAGGAGATADLHPPQDGGGMGNINVGPAPGPSIIGMRDYGSAFPTGGGSVSDGCDGMPSLDSHADYSTGSADGRCC